MAMLIILPVLASVFLQEATAHGGYGGPAFPGYLPLEYVKGVKPVGDDRPNDVYQHLPRRLPVLASSEVVIYPHTLGFEYGQDTEGRVYQVHDTEQLKRQHEQKYGKMKKMNMNMKHSKHNKHGSEHNGNSIDEQTRHKEEPQQRSQKKHQRQQEDESQLSIQQTSYNAPKQQQQQQFRPRPAFRAQSGNVHPHFG